MNTLKIEAEDSLFFFRELNRMNFKIVSCETLEDAFEDVEKEKAVFQYIGNIKVEVGKKKPKELNQETFIASLKLTLEKVKLTKQEKINLLNIISKLEKNLCTKSERLSKKRT